MRLDGADLPLDSDAITSDVHTGTGVIVGIEVGQGDRGPVLGDVDLDGRLLEED